MALFMFKLEMSGTTYLPNNIENDDSVHCIRVIS